jgi:hypothetical protein
MTASLPDGLFKQFLPRQVRMQVRYDDLGIAAIGAIVDYFHAPHGMPSEETLSSVLERNEIRSRLAECFPTSRTSHLGNALSSDSNRVHHPENHEFDATLRTGSEKFIVHRALSLLYFGAQYSGSDGAAPGEMVSQGLWQTELP